MERKRKIDDDDTKLYCLCKRKNDPEKPMVQCEICEEWFHLMCVGLHETQSQALAEWYCHRCEDITKTNPCITKQGAVQLRGRNVPKDGWGSECPLQYLEEKDFPQLLSSLRNKQEGYALFRGGKIQLIEGCLKTGSTNYFVHAECRADMTTQMYSVYLCFDNQDELYINHYNFKWMYCHCPAGSDGNCKHGLAVIFYVIDFSRSGKALFPQSSSHADNMLTSQVKIKPCDDPLLFSDILAHKHDPEEPLQNGVCYKTHKPVPGFASVVSEQNIQRLVSLFEKSGVQLPVIDTIKLNNCLPVTPKEHGDFLLTEELFDNIGHYHIENDKTIPFVVSYADLLNKNERKFYDSLIKVNLKQCVDIEKKTRFQSKTTFWFEKRAFRITASMFGKLCKMLPSADPIKVFEQGHKYVTSKSVQHELMYESAAINLYLQNNSDVEFISPVGFVISPEIPFLGASPDRIAKNKSGELFLIEVKCPYDLHEHKFSIKKGIGSGKFFLEQEYDESDARLKMEHDYFYQIQGQLHVCNVQFCDLVVFKPPRDIRVVRIVKDDKFFKDVFLKLTQIWFKNLCGHFVKI